MDQSIARIIAGIQDFARLATFEENVRKRNRLTPEVAEAIKGRGIELGRDIVVKGAALDVSQLTQAEEKILRAASEYASVKKRLGTHAQRTINQIRDQGLIEAAETSVTRSRPTQGFETLSDEDLAELSYEQIVVDHPEEFSTRALWHARRRLGLPNASEKPPAKAVLAAQRRTVALLEWLRLRATTNKGLLANFSNADAAAALGMTQLQHEGRAFGNIVSRLDFACYRLGLPPLGLTVSVPFKNAWQTDGSWKFPIETMAAAAKSYRWSDLDFTRILSETESYPGLAHFMWKAEPVEPVRAWAMRMTPGARESEQPPPRVAPRPASRNPSWTREEHILALDLYFTGRGTSYDEKRPEVIAVSEELRALAVIRGMSGSSTFRNPAGVSMKMMNFRRLDPAFTKDGKVGLNHANKSEETVWADFANDRPALVAAAAEIRRIIADGNSRLDFARTDQDDERYWVFVCNPAKWAIDRFLASGRTVDTWGVRKSDASKFAPGQLGLLRVGVDRRSQKERGGNPLLSAGIYALLQVESAAYPGTGANDEFWSEDAAREPGWPTVQVRYLRIYADRPLTVDSLRSIADNIDPLILDGFQGATFPISNHDFETVMSAFGEDVEELPASLPMAPDTPDRLAELEAKFMHASPQVKTRLSKAVERGPIGNHVKKANGYKCQLCEALGREPLGFKKRKTGQHYVEAHHVMPVSTKQVGVLSASNVMTLCANHHREAHYGDLDVEIEETGFTIRCDGEVLTIPKIMMLQGRLTGG